MQSILSRMCPRRRVMYGLLGAVSLLTLWLLGSFVVAYHLTRRQQPLFAETAPTVDWGKFEDQRLTTRDGQEIGTWFVAGKDDSPSVLLLHGNGGCRSSCLFQAEMLAAEHYPILMITQRAHGDSTGDVNDFGYSARYDVIAAVDWLQQRRPGKPIAVFGSSLGSAAAVFASGELKERVSGYILECPYQDLKTAVRNRTAIYLPPVADWIAYKGIDIVAPLVLPDVEKISPLEAATQLPKEVPILIMAGGADRHATPEEARAIFDRVRTHAHLVIFDGATHGKLFDADPNLYRHSVLELLEKVGRGYR
jgi:uncharacterized protein